MCASMHAGSRVDYAVCVRGIGLAMNSPPTAVIAAWAGERAEGLAERQWASFTMMVVLLVAMCPSWLSETENAMW